MRAWEHKWEQIFLLYAYKLFIISLLYRQWGHEGINIRTSSREKLIRQEHFWKLSENKTVLQEPKSFPTILQMNLKQTEKTAF